MALKKSLFSKPKWAATTATPVNEDQPIFGQNVYEDILEANRKREEKRLARQKEKEEKKAQQRKSGSVDTKFEDQQAVKKRRVSTPIQLDDDENDDGYGPKNSDSDSEQSDKSVRSGSQRSDASHDEDGRPGLRSTPKKKRRLVDRLESPSPAKGGNAVITIDEDDMVGEQAQRSQGIPAQASKSKTKPPPPPPPESESESEEEDEYIRELKRKAREAARTKRSLTTTTTSTQLPNKPLDDRQSPSAAPLESTHHIDDPTAGSDHGTPTPNADPNDQSDTKVQILVTTIMPGCSELVAQRYASQPLDQLFKYWKKKNELDQRKLDDKVFFIWNCQKLYNSTTCRSILEQIKRKHGTKKDGSDLAEGKIQIEAVTQHIFDLRLKQRDRARADAEGTPDTTTNTTAAAITAATDDPLLLLEQHQQQQQKPGVVIHLTSRDKSILPFLNLRVRPDTTVARIISGYKRKVSVDPARLIYLVFDGDKLEDGMTVEGIGFESEDVVEVVE